MILGLIISSSVQQHKCSLGFEGATKQESVCRRIRNFLGKFTFDSNQMARALVSLCSITGALHLSLDRTNWKFGCIDINLLVLAVKVSEQSSIPLLWKALPKCGNSNAEERIDLMKRPLHKSPLKKIKFLSTPVEICYNFRIKEEITKG